MTQVLISLGSNIDREFHIREGIRALAEIDPKMRCSRIFEAEPVGFEGPNFYNCVVEIHTDKPLAEFAADLRSIESRWGRERDAIKFRDRTLDLDLLTFGDLCQEANPPLPRSDIYKFAFTLWPLAEMFPDQPVPGDGRTYAELWKAFDKAQALWPVDPGFIEEN
ncbi:2-amino-4-hydroxy-6-hydroxymethyldihydropteridine diphosphokinase [Parasalinivibrio latis]|uniref:2-amino-4-hydroxy-6- hydroxymethyldihydropteridine diphosphokinase n=1 Tax=Parasalinivibrio latis TaxID=2952610 RepID=UPI0030E3C975